MASLRFDTEQRFSCASCARCCTRPWEVVVTPAEAVAYRERYGDAFEPIPKTNGFHRIRKREDGACVFLTAANRCRIHEELGERAKPLTCRMFPFSFHPIGDVDVVRASFACPTIVANTGASTSEAAQLESLKTTRTDWFRTYPRVAAPLLLRDHRPIETETLRILRTSLLQMLARPDSDGQIDLRRNVTRIANTLDDLSRSAVTRLPAVRFAEYVGLTTPFAAKKDEKPAKYRAPSWTGRLMQRGFLFVTAATQLRVGPKSHALSPLALRLKTVKLLAHFHGLAQGVEGLDLRLLGSAEMDLNGPELRPIAYNYLRSSIQTLGTGVRPVIDELAVAVSSLNAACALAMMRAAKAGHPVDKVIFSEALVDAVDVSHADYGLIARVLTMFASGTDALYALGS